ncbi:MAG: hypothetical protein IT267_00010 [Saprospiraceae bacterium]|nr:hypothetical protein [Saprospiraceae bacterium]
MKRIFTLVVTLVLVSLFTNCYSQTSLPTLKDPVISRQLIEDEINSLYETYKSNPTIELERKIDLFNKTLEILNEPLSKPASTAYAVNSSFLYFEQKYNPNISDTEAFRRLNQGQWSLSFNELVNLLKQ